ncbi:MAG: hypothetical protein LAP86_10460 [Acidobacteriia bacterium]|nr:hypothetical protein [Terriglobia bacterium]
MRGFMAVVVLFLSIPYVVAQNSGDPALQVHQDDGGSVSVRTIGGWMNQDSSLKRTWFVVDDPNAPARLERAGVFPRLDEKEGVHYFVPVATVSPKQAISAVEVRYMLFDVWGDRIRTLSVTRLVDSATHIEVRESNRFPALESEAGQLVMLVAFVAHVRTADGRTWAFDPPGMVRQIRDLGLNCAPADLAPDEQKLIDPQKLYWTYAPARRQAATKDSQPSRP